MLNYARLCSTTDDLHANSDYLYLLNRATLTADMIIWPCKRLGIPRTSFSSGWRMNCPPCCWGTLIPEGRGIRVRSTCAC